MSNFRFTPTLDHEVNQAFCWLLIDWFTEMERSAAEDAILALPRGEPTDDRNQTESQRRYLQVVASIDATMFEMRGFAELHNPMHDASAIALMIDPVIEERARNPSVGNPQWEAKIKAKSGSGEAIVEDLIRKACDRVHGRDEAAKQRAQAPLGGL